MCILKIICLNLINNTHITLDKLLPIHTLDKLFTIHTLDKLFTMHTLDKLLTIHTCVYRK
jgi:hypothetical protein